MNTSGGKPVEDQVAGEQHALVWEPGDDVTGRVGRVARMLQFDHSRSGVHRQAIIHGDRRHSSGDRSPVGKRRPHRWAAVDDRVGEQSRTHRRVPDDDCLAGEQAVAVRVVAVLVGVDRNRDRCRPCRHTDGVEEPPRPPVGRARVDDDGPASVRSIVWGRSVSIRRLGKIRVRV